MSEAKLHPVDSSAPNYGKVVTYPGGVMHLTEGGGLTLCNRLWFFRCDHGTLYCKTCQKILAKKQNPKSQEREASSAQDSPGKE